MSSAQYAKNALTHSISLLFCSLEESFYFWVAGRHRKFNGNYVE